MCEDDSRHNVTIASDLPKHHDVDWVFGFNPYEYESVLRLTSKHTETFVLELPPWILNNIICSFQISGEMNCVMVLLSSQTMPNWL